MNFLKSTISLHSDAYSTNRAAMQALVDELNARQAQARVQLVEEGLHGGAVGGVGSGVGRNGGLEEHCLALEVFNVTNHLFSAEQLVYKHQALNNCSYRDILACVDNARMRCSTCGQPQEVCILC